MIEMIPDLIIMNKQIQIIEHSGSFSFQYLAGC